jgi:hypothetical protein
MEAERKQLESDLDNVENEFSILDIIHKNEVIIPSDTRTDIPK